MKKITTIIALSLIVLSLSACNEGHAKSQIEVKPISEAQQLIELIKAADDGAISQEEFLTAKSKLLSRSLINTPQSVLAN